MCPVLQPRVMGTKLIVCFVFPVLHDQRLLWTAILNNLESKFVVADDANIFVFIELENIVDHLNFANFTQLSVVRQGPTSSLLE